MYNLRTELEVALSIINTNNNHLPECICSPMSNHYPYIQSPLATIAGQVLPGYVRPSRDAGLEYSAQ